MTTDGTAIFYDGLTAKRRAVSLSFEPDAVALSEDGRTVARWAYVDIRRDVPGDTAFRLRSATAPDLARLDIADAGQTREFTWRCPNLERHERATRGSTVRILLWSLAAAASVVLTVVYLLPPLADKLAPFIPVAAEKRIGQAVDKQLRVLLPGKVCTSPEGTAALLALGEKLTAGADLPMKPEILVLSSGIPNAAALPGGRIYLFEGLLGVAHSPDEVAGVLAHEVGHIVHRHNMRRLIQVSGTSFLLGLLFGDITGAGALIFAGEGLISGAHSREAESEADRFAADAMTRLGRSPRPLGVFLLRMTGQGSKTLRLFASHPLSQERLAALSKIDVPSTGPPLLDDQQWQALKSICK